MRWDRFYLDAVNTAVPLHRAGKVRILGVTSADRVPSAPELPAMREQGFDFRHDSWFGICTTAGTPKSVMAAVPQSLPSAEAFAADMREQTQTWASIIRPLKLTLYGAANHDQQDCRLHRSGLGANA